MSAKKPTFIDPDDLCERFLVNIQDRITSAIDFRVGVLKNNETRFSQERTDELRLLRNFVKTVIYSENDWKKLFEENK